ncbi:MAG: cytochrome C [Rudaea sp.]
MRNLFVFLLGIAIGALATANIISALRQRDAYPRGLMDVMQYHLGALRTQAKMQHCTEEVSAHLAVMRVLSHQIEPAIYGNEPSDPEFGADASHLRNALDLVGDAAAPPASCAALMRAVIQVGQACDTCHRSYR